MISLSNESEQSQFSESLTEWEQRHIHITCDNIICGQHCIITPDNHSVITYGCPHVYDYGGVQAWGTISQIIDCEVLIHIFWKFIFLWFWFCWSNICCGGMCKIVAWSVKYFPRKCNSYFHEIWIMSSLPLSEMDPCYQHQVINKQS